MDTRPYVETNVAARLDRLPWSASASAGNAGGRLGVSQAGYFGLWPEGSGKLSPGFTRVYPGKRILIW